MNVEGRQFVDSNVLIYAHDRSAGRKHEEATTLLKLLWQSQDGCLSVQVMQELYVTITQKVAAPLPRETAANLISELSTWTIHRPGPQDVLVAIRLQSRYQTSFWDAMIIASAIQLECSTLWSEDLSTEQVYETVTVRSPFVASE